MAPQTLHQAAGTVERGLRGGTAQRDERRLRSGRPTWSEFPRRPGQNFPEPTPSRARRRIVTKSYIRRRADESASYLHSSTANCLLIVRDRQLPGDRRQWWIGSPQSQTTDEGGREQVYINPADTAAVQASFANEPYDVAVIYNRSLVHLRVVGQELRSPALVADEKLPVHEVVAAHLLAVQQPIKFRRVRCSVRKKADPDGAVHQDDHAAERFLADGRSRFRLDSRAALGSDPRRARSRSYAARRINASSPNRIVSVSVLAPHADFAFLSRP